LFFLVLSPKNTSGPHIQALALISRNLSINTNRDRLKSAKSVDEIIDIFSTFN
jgi:mannitol/fructose-specific phosphotransferase system IIA component (Ntr-type)